MDKKVKKTRLVGTVVSNKAGKTITVEVVRSAFHKKYKKRYQKSRKFYAHDENEKAQEGNVVEIIECRPISKQKRFRLIKILK